VGRTVDEVIICKGDGHQQRITDLKCYHFKNVSSIFIKNSVSTWENLKNLKSYNKTMHREPPQAVPKQLPTTTYILYHDRGKKFK